MARGCKYRYASWVYVKRHGQWYGRYNYSTYRRCRSLLSGTFAAAAYVGVWYGPNFVHYTLFF